MIIFQRITFMLDNLYIGLAFSKPLYKHGIADDQNGFKGF